MAYIQIFPLLLKFLEILQIFAMDIIELSDAETVNDLSDVETYYDVNNLQFFLVNIVLFKVFF